MTPGCGYITVATGERRYLEYAIDLALSLRAFNPEPIALMLGDELRPFATPAHLAPFDHVVAMPGGYPGALGKMAAPAATPFARTLFIDADCIAIGGVGEVWRNLDSATSPSKDAFSAPAKTRCITAFRPRRWRGGSASSATSGTIPGFSISGRPRGSRWPRRACGCAKADSAAGCRTKTYFWHRSGRGWASRRFRRRCRCRGGRTSSSRTTHDSASFTSWALCRRRR